ncbi:MAG: type II toxin-antitoxin system ParD family antitoxin [Magnetococcales bacterium]|nr:type II toxin-antitoxin system ParD family antitoxin [Magnetococcales bacterium]
MQNSTCVVLDPYFEAFINQQVALGRFASASEAVQAGLQLLEEQETKLATLRQALESGEASGRSDYSLPRLLEELDSEELR